MTPGERQSTSALLFLVLLCLKERYPFARTLAICIIVHPTHEPKEMPGLPKKKFVKLRDPRPPQPAVLLRHAHANHANAAQRMQTDLSTHRITSHSFTIPLFPKPPPMWPLFPFCEKTSQNRSVSSPAPVTIVPPSGLMLRYKTR